MFLLFHFGFSCRTNTNDGNTTTQLGETFLKFFLVVIAGALIDLGADFLDAAFDVALLAFATNDGCILFVGDDFLSAAKVLKGSGLKFAARLFRDHGATGERSNILQHGLAAVTTAG